LVDAGYDGGGSERAGRGLCESRLKMPRPGGAGCNSISGVWVKMAGRKNKTLLFCRRRGPVLMGVSGSSILAPAMVLTRFRIRLKASTRGLWIRPAYISLYPNESGGGETGRESKGRWMTGTSSVGVSLTGEESSVEVPEAEYDEDLPTWKCQLPERESLGRMMSYPLEKRLPCLAGSLIRPMINMSNPNHMRPLPQVPKKPIKAASSACQLLP